MPRAFNPPPGWPKPEEGWTPPPGWRPDPSWPEPPQGWDFWIEKAEETGSTLFSSTAASASSLFGDVAPEADAYGIISDPEPGYQGGTRYGAPESPTHASSMSTTDSSTDGSAGYGGSGGEATGPTGPGGYGPSAPTGNYGGGNPYSSGTSTGPASTVGSGPGPTAPPSSPTAPTDARPQRGTSSILLGLLIMAISAGVTAYSYFNPGADGTFTIWWAPAVVGVLLVIQGVAQAVRARKADGGRRRTPGGYSPRKEVTPPGGRSRTRGKGQSGGFETGHSSTVPIQNPTDPKLYRRN
ncbi:MAG TPA: hypothetical protein VK095_05470 [Beutenbergiaceae bacterium]|nr:hypothetical protein [Beutenbergiaceae bacterium]